MSIQNAGGLHQRGLIGFRSASSEMANKRGAVEKELEDVQQVLGYGETNEGWSR